MRTLTRFTALRFLPLAFLLTGITQATAWAERSPEDTVAAYYASIQSGSCDEAIRLRPGYRRQSCEAIKAIQVLDIRAKDIGRDHAIILISVQFARNGTKRNELFTGFVALKRKGSGWTIDGDTYRSGMGLTQYRNWVASRRSEDVDVSFPTPRPAAPLPITDIPKPQLRAVSSEPRGIQLDRLLALGTRSDSGNLSFGSSEVLRRCWSSPQINSRGAIEKAILKTGAEIRLDRPDHVTPTYLNASLADEARKSIRSVDTRGRKLVALTFDVCEQNDEKTGYDGEIVDVLRANGVSATFYLGGKWMATHEERAMQIIADPLFEAGNHAWTHGNLRVLGGQEMKEQITFTQAQYETTVTRLLARSCARSAGASEMSKIPLRMATFRYPYGTCSRESIEAVNGLGMAAVQWDVVSGDPARKASAQSIVDRVVGSVKPGSIVVMHANGRGWKTGRALPSIIRILKKRGYRFVTVSELLASGRPRTAQVCYELKPGDNSHYDRLFGRGTGD